MRRGNIIFRSKRPLTEDLTEKIVRVFGFPAARLPIKKDLAKLSSSSVY
jgi:hypothetical protein